MTNDGLEFPAQFIVTRPACPNCKCKEMWLTKVEKPKWDVYERKTFECPRCQYEKVVFVRPLSPVVTLYPAHAGASGMSV